MKTIKILGLFLFTCAVPYFASAEASPQVSQTSTIEKKAAEDFVGYWRSVEDPRYYFEFTSNGEYYRYKLDNALDPTSAVKNTNNYTIVRDLFIKMDNGERSEYGTYIFLNNNILEFFIDNKNVLLQRVDKKDFDGMMKKLSVEVR